MATKPPEEVPETLKYKTWVLKVSIHCEGCKKEVKKILQSIEGVYMTTVDIQQNKVTVTGNVEADTLIKKLLKSGKRAEVLPEKIKEKPGKQKNNEKQIIEDIDQTNIDDENSHDTKDMSSTEGGEDQIDEDDEGENEEAVGNGGGGGKKKKKKKKKKTAGTSGSSSANDGGDQNSGDAQAGSTVTPSPGPHDDHRGATSMAAMNLSPPRPQMYPFPPVMNYPAGPPLYGVSYNTTYPRDITPSYHPFHPMHANTHPLPEIYRQPPPPVSHQTYPFREVHDDDDEYPSLCSLM